MSLRHGYHGARTEPRTGRTSPNSVNVCRFQAGPSVAKVGQIPPNIDRSQAHVGRFRVTGRDQPRLARLRVSRALRPKLARFPPTLARRGVGRNRAEVGPNVCVCVAQSGGQPSSDFEHPLCATFAKAARAAREVLAGGWRSAQIQSAVDSCGDNEAHNIKRQTSNEMVATAGATERDINTPQRNELEAALWQLCVHRRRSHGQLCINTQHARTRLQWNTLCQGRAPVVGPDTTKATHTRCTKLI